MFVDEDQWARAYTAARNEVEALECSGLLLPQTWESRTLIATRIATAALRAAARDDEGDISELPGVSVDQVDGLPYHRGAPPYWQDLYDG